MSSFGFSRRQHGPGENARPHTTPIALLLGLIALNVLLRSQLLMPWVNTDYPATTDEWSQQTIGYLWSHHDVLPYRDVVCEHKSPGQFFFYWFTTRYWGTSMLAAHLLVLCSGTITALLLVWMGRVAFNSTTVGLLAGFFWTLTAAAPYMDTHYAFNEIFAVPFAALGWGAALLACQRKSIPWAVLSGFGLACAFLWKQPWLLEILVAGGCIAWMNREQWHKMLLAFIVGVSVPLGTTAVYLDQLGILPQALHVIFLGPLDQAKIQLSERLYRFLLFLGRYLAPSMLWFVPCILALPRAFSRKASPEKRVLTLWLLSALPGFMATGKFSDYQFIQVLPSLSVLGALGARDFVERVKGLDPSEFRWLRKAVVLIVIWAIGMSLAPFCVLTMTRYAHYQWTGEKVQDPHLEAKLDVSERVRELTSPNDRVFMWGEMGFVHMLADRVPATGYYQNLLPRRSQTMKDNIMSELQAAPPKLIVWEKMGGLHTSDAFPALSQFMEDRYELADSVQQYELYVRMPDSSS